jgi:RNA polymerase sigma-70 factor, ECF subfamily
LSGSTTFWSVTRYSYFILFAPSSRISSPSPCDPAGQHCRRMGLMADGGRQYLVLADEDLISLVETGDADAFAALYDRHSSAAFSLAYRMMGERQASEDLAQDAFLKVWRGAGSYRVARGSVRTWILSIVHNRGIDQLRSHASRRRTQDKIEATAPRSQPSEAFAETLRNSQRDQVREAMGTLPSEQLKILELAYFSGYTHVEISELLGLPLGTVKGRMRLGLKKIRDFFESKGAAVPR